jgi:hypothetical protein
MRLFDEHLRIGVPTGPKIEVRSGSRHMRLLNVPLGLLFGFHEIKLVGGISRSAQTGPNNP